MRLLAIILGVVIAAFGGVIAYRALYLEPPGAIVITESKVEEVPNYTRVIGGTVLLIGGAALAFLAASRRSK